MLKDYINSNAMLDRHQPRCYGADDEVTRFGMTGHPVIRYEEPAI